MKKLSFWFCRILIACLFGSAIAYVNLNAGRGIATDFVRGERSSNQTRMRVLGAIITDYQKDEHKLPPDINALVSKDYADKEWLYDTWKRPFLYRVKGKQYVLTTYGRDGKPGGVGLDADQTLDNPHSKISGMTFAQFLSYPDARDMVNWGIICGITAALLCGFLVRPVTLKKENLPPLAIGLLFLLLALSVASIFIMFLHTSVGH